MLQFDATDADLVMFLDEAAEQLRTLSDGLLRMERAATDTALLQAVFRAAHTLKGSSATIGHQRMAALTHAMESVLDNIRKGTLAVESAVIDSLLACVDALGVLNQEVQTKTESTLDVDTLVARLHEVAAPKSASVALPAPTHAAPPHPATDAAGRILEMEVRIQAGSSWPAVRAYQVLMEVAALGTILRSSPTEADLQGGEGGHRLTVTIATERPPEALEAAARGVSEVEAVAVWDAAAPVAVVVERRDDHTVQPHANGEEHRRIDLGPETRGASLEEQLVVAGARLATVSRMVKVDIARLDEMMNLVGELVIDRGRLMQVLCDLETRFGADASLEQLSDISEHLARVSDDLQQQVMLSRLLPVEHVFNRFPRMIRDLARKTGKRLRFVVEGQETELDRSVIDEIGDPLLHLLRNAVDHGAEPPEERTAAGKPEEATLMLSARHEESQIVIEVTDDGRGMDPRKLRDAAVRKGLLSADAAGRLSDDEAINLIFAPGFSSAEKVTDISGRGVGMDIVRTNIEKINGALCVSTHPGEGTTFTIRLPLTLAIIRALLVRVGDAVFTIPLASVQETLRINMRTVHTVAGREVVLMRNQTLPLVRLADLFARPGDRPARQDGQSRYLVAVRAGTTHLGLLVDALIGEQDVVIKSLGGVLGEVEGIAGATILGDGRVSMIIDVPKVVEGLAAGAA